MSLKLIVNDHTLWDPLVEELSERIIKHDKVLRQATDETTIYRQQGAILALESLLRLRDEVNGRRT